MNRYALACTIKAVVLLVGLCLLLICVFEWKKEYIHMDEDK